VSADRYIFRLDGANYIILDSLTIEADESSTYGFPIHFLSGSSNNIVRNCTTKVPITSTSSNYGGINFSGSTTSASTGGANFSSNLIENNTIIGGYYTLSIYGTTAGQASNNGN